MTFAAGGLAIFDVSDLGVGPVLAEVSAASEAPGTGCGLIPHPDGERLYTNSGSKALGDAENVYVWGTTKRSPVVTATCGWRCGSTRPRTR